MGFWELDGIKSATSGTWLARPAPELRVAPTGLSIDSRTIERGQAFLALKGERTDGHEYLEAALKGGASMLIVDRPSALGSLLQSLPPSVSVLQVADSGKALLQMAGAYRKTLESTRVIAVGGSNGKTTTTRLIECVLSSTLRGTASKKSFNNAVGVPLTILRARRTDQFLICEVGTNAPGEIAVLSAVLQPDIAVITSIGREHLEGLGSIEGVVAEEARLLEDVRPGGVAIITGDSLQLTQRVLGVATEKRADRTVLRFGFSGEAELRLTSVEVTPQGTTFTINERSTYSVPLLGAHNASNAAAAIAVAKRLGLSDETIHAALATARGAEMRLQVVEKATGDGVIRVLNDAYNANPESMLAALSTFSACFAPRLTSTPAQTPTHAERLATKRRVMILGQMLELGGAGAQAHREIGEAVAALDDPGASRSPDLAIFVGALMKHAHDAAAARLDPSSRITLAHIPQTDDAAMRQIAQLLRPGDAVLLKGSRGVGLERVLDHLAPATTPRVEAKPAPRATSAA